MATDILLLVAAYLVGAVPTGLLVGKAVKGIDVREHGSKNIGATNVMRVLGWKLGAATLAIDAGKAAGAVLAAAQFATGAIPQFAIAAGCAVLLGNFFNVFLGGKGGKGVATSLGVFLALCPVPMAITFLIFAAVVGATRYVSLGSIIASISLPLLVWRERGLVPLVWMVAAIAALIVWKHRANVQRLLAGTESKIGKKAEARIGN